MQHSDTPPNILISVGIHPKLNRLPRGTTKEARQADKARMNASTAEGWQRREFSLNHLASHLETGASIAAVFVDGHRHTESAQAQFIAVDFDKDRPDRIVIEADARALGCAAIIGETTTAGHYRVLIPLAEIISNPEQFRDLALRVIHQFHSATDPASGVIAQPWYGFQKGTVTLLQGESLTVDAIRALPAPPQPDRAWRREPAPLTEGTAQERRDEFIRVVVLPAVERAATRGREKYFNCINPDHPDKHPSARIGDGHDGDLVYFCTCGTHSLVTVGHWLGLSYRQWLSETYPAEAKTQKRQRADRPLRSRGASNWASGAAPVEFVGDVLTPAKISAERTLLIHAPTGIGKTTAVAQYVATLPPNAPKTAVAQFRLLTRTAGQAFDFAHYEDSDSAHQRQLGQLPELVSSVQSLAKFDRQGGTVILDELEGDLRFVTDSSTFRGGEAIIAYRALRRLVQTADQLIGMDANLSDIAIEWIEALRGKATVKHFTSVKQRGNVAFLRDDNAGIYQIGKLLRQRRGAVYVACSSEESASQIAELYAEYRVLKVTRDTSNTAVVGKASTDAVVRAGYDLIVYDSSWGAGVSIDEPVYAQVCICGRQPLAPEDALQLWGRVRNAQRRYAVTPADSDGYPTLNADQLITDKLTRELWTATKTGLAPQVSGDILEHLQLWAKFEARRQREMAQWRRSFMRRLQANGYSYTENNAPAPASFVETFKQWRIERKDRYWNTVLKAVGTALPDEKLDSLRMKGVEIDETLKLRNTRFKIEQVLAVETVSEQDRDLMNSRNRHRLIRLSNLMEDEIETLDSDRQAGEEGQPLHKRRYATLDRRTTSRLFTLVGQSGTPEQQLLAFVDYFRQERSASEVEARYVALKSDRAIKLFEALGHRDNNSRTVTGLCRWLVNYFGLKLISCQRRFEGARCMFYQMDADVLAYRLARARQAVQARLLSRNVISLEENTFLDSPVLVVSFFGSASTDRTAEIPIRNHSPLDNDLDALGLAKASPPGQPCLS